MYSYGLHNEIKRSYTKQQHFLQLVSLLFVKGHKIESEENIKEKFDIGVVLWVTHICHYSIKLTFKVSLIIYRSSVTHINSPKLPLKLTDMLWATQKKEAVTWFTVC